MYIEELISIGRAENGFVVEVRVPFDPEGELKDCCCCCPSTEMKQFLVSEPAEVGEKIAEILPMLKDEMNAEAVFNQMVKEMADE
jgi:hypothetical protein